MSPREPSVPIPSPLTNSKLLVAFKGIPGTKINIDAVSRLGDKYMQKETSIRFVLLLYIGLYIFRPHIFSPLKMSAAKLVGIKFDKKLYLLHTTFWKTYLYNINLIIIILGVFLPASITCDWITGSSRIQGTLVP